MKFSLSHQSKEEAFPFISSDLSLFEEDLSSVVIDIDSSLASDLSAVAIDLSVRRRSLFRYHS